MLRGIAEIGATKHTPPRCLYFLCLDSSLRYRNSELGTDCTPNQGIKRICHAEEGEARGRRKAVEGRKGTNEGGGSILPSQCFPGKQDLLKYRKFRAQKRILSQE